VIILFIFRLLNFFNFEVVGVDFLFISLRLSLFLLFKFDFDFFNFFVPIKSKADIDQFLQGLGEVRRLVDVEPRVQHGHIEHQSGQVLGGFV
jgi:hypothetical protein